MCANSCQDKNGSEDSAQGCRGDCPDGDKTAGKRGPTLITIVKFPPADRRDAQTAIELKETDPLYLLERSCLPASEAASAVAALIKSGTIPDGETTIDLDRFDDIFEKSSPAPPLPWKMPEF